MLIPHFSKVKYTLLNSFCTHWESQLLMSYLVTRCICGKWHLLEAWNASIWPFKECKQVSLLSGFLQLVNGHLEYFSQVNQQEPVRWRHRQRVSDGSWHDVVLSRMLEPGGLVTLAVDGHKHQISTEFALHDFLDPFLTSFTIGGRWEQNSLSPGALPGRLSRTMRK